MYTETIARLIFIFFLVGLLSACFESRKSHTPPTTFSLAVTDAPVDDARYVVIEFSAVVLQPNDGERIILSMEDPVRIDLLALQGRMSQYLVMDREIPPGEYEWVGLAINANLNGLMNSYIELKNGAQLELDIPSGDENGLHLTRGFVLQEGGKVDFTVDFDLRRSIIIPRTAAVASAVLRPTLRMVETRYAGSIEGEIDENIIAEYCARPDTEYGAVYVFDGGSEVRDVFGTEGPITSAMVDYHNGSYRYEVGFLAAGTYQVVYTCDAALDNPETNDDLTFIYSDSDFTTVGLAENVTLDFALTQGATGALERRDDLDEGEAEPQQPIPGSEPEPEPSPPVPESTPAENTNPPENAENQRQRGRPAEPGNSNRANPNDDNDDNDDNDEDDEDDEDDDEDDDTRATQPT